MKDLSGKDGMIVGHVVLRESGAMFKLYFQTGTELLRVYLHRAGIQLLQDLFSLFNGYLCLFFFDQSEIPSFLLTFFTSSADIYSGRFTMLKA